MAHGRTLPKHTIATPTVQDGAHSASRATRLSALVLTWLLLVVAAAVTPLVVPGTPAVAAGVAGRHGPDGNWRGLPVTLEPLPSSLRVPGTGRAWRLRYLSTGWNGHPTLVSGTVSLPVGTPPAGGWPMVGFGPGFNGTPDQCAASRDGTPPFAVPLSEALLRAGYAVAVTDFDGIGTPGESSVTDGRSEAYAIIDIARAARRIAPVSRSWSSVGYSLGGHGALWAGALADSYAAELHNVGTIAISPVTQWGLLWGLVRDPGAPVTPTIPYMGRSLPLTTRGAFRPADWFTPRGLQLVDLAGKVCIGDMAAEVAGLTMKDVFIDPSAAVDELTKLFATQEIPLQRRSRPVRLAHGTADQSLPEPFTEITAGQLAAGGTDVTFTPVPGADHFTVLAPVAPQVVDWLGDLFARAQRS